MLTLTEASANFSFFILNKFITFWVINTGEEYQWQNEWKILTKAKNNLCKVNAGMFYNNIWHRGFKKIKATNLIFASLATAPSNNKMSLNFG